MKKVCKENNGLPPISWAGEVATYVQNYIQDDAETNIYLPNLPISDCKDGTHSTENDQQFSHEDTGASEARFNAEYERGTAGEEGDDSGDKKDGGAEGGKGDDTAEINFGKNDNL
jgi:hypothetical protein